jgi:2-polyprenyl-6-methoxyphenol hydroxylase-like FAD-dependent oxidoreductase
MIQCMANTWKARVNDQYDAIVVGARCAGATTAMLLARRGYRVLVVDRARFPSDTLSTHVIHAPGVAALDRWGLLNTVLATGCPPIEHYSFDFGPVVIKGTTRPAGGHTTAYAPRRIVLDEILINAAATAGATVRQEFNVDGLMFDDGKVCGIRGHITNGNQESLRARIVIGADGRASHVAKAVHARSYQEEPRLQWPFYTYFSGLPVDGFETYIRPFRGFAAAGTNDGLTMLVVGWPYAEARSYKADVEGNYYGTLELAPHFAARVRAARREAPFLGGAVPNYLRVPFGRGWALVGDAGYTKDPITAQGITDAFRDAELCSAAIDHWLSGRIPFDEAFLAWHRERDREVLPTYKFTTQLATLEPPPAEMQQLLAAIQGNQAAMDDFVSVNAGTLSPEVFFSPEHLAQTFEAAAIPG